MNLVGTTVTHKFFGKGVVIAQDENALVVQFVNKTMKFVCPDAFEG